MKFLQLQKGVLVKPRKFDLSINKDGYVREEEKEIVGNIWDFIGKATVIIIPTTNFVTNGKHPMGAGLEAEALKRYSDLDVKIASRIQDFGSYPFIVKCDRQTMIMTFPIKPAHIYVNSDKSNVVSHARSQYQVGEKIPGYFSKACPKVIRESARSLNMLIETMKGRWKRIMFPKIGGGCCGKLNCCDIDWRNNVMPIFKEENLYDQPIIQFISRN